VKKAVVWVLAAVVGIGTPVFLAVASSPGHSQVEPQVLLPPDSFDPMRVCMRFVRHHAPGTELRSSGAMTVDAINRWSRESRGERIAPWKNMAVSTSVANCYFSAADRSHLVGAISPRADDRGEYYGTVLVDSDGNWSAAPIRWKDFYED
jgi:hypothetical protein